jgi:hypothetical protein
VNGKSLVIYHEDIEMARGKIIVNALWPGIRPQETRSCKRGQRLLR